ncbi:hypothetical protein ACSBR2_029003 [Camellia fascicularis]
MTKNYRWIGSLIVEEERIHILHQKHHILPSNTNTNATTPMHKVQLFNAPSDCTLPCQRPLLLSSNRAVQKRGGKEEKRTDIQGKKETVGSEYPLSFKRGKTYQLYKTATSFPPARSPCISIQIFNNSSLLIPITPKLLTPRSLLATSIKMSQPPQHTTTNDHLHTTIPFENLIYSWLEYCLLLLKQRYNYGGIQARINSETFEGISEPENGIVHDESQVDIVSSWNIVENLPKATQVRELAEKQSEDGIFKMLSIDVTWFLTTILIGTTVVNIGATALVTNAATTIFGEAGVAVLLLTEITPKSIAVHNATEVARFVVQK